MHGRLRTFAVMGVFVAAWPTGARAQEPRWQGTVATAPDQQAAVQQLDIRFRPYRPFHFYGNTVRRIYYRGNPLPTPTDIVESSQALFANQPPPPRPSF